MFCYLLLEEVLLEVVAHALEGMVPGYKSRKVTIEAFKLTKTRYQWN